MNESYQNYIKSREWKQKKKTLFKSKRYRLKYKESCFCCRIKFDNKNRPNVHHKTYKNFKKENKKDLVPVCRKCHKAIHKLNRVYGVRLDKCHFLLRRVIILPKLLFKAQEKLSKSSLVRYNVNLKNVENLQSEIKLFGEFL